MTRKQFLTLLGFTHAAAACSSRYIVGVHKPSHHQEDTWTIHYSDEGTHMVRFNHGRVEGYYQLEVPYDQSKVTPLDWPPQLQKIATEASV